ncbi:MAG: hypothetical protein GF331_05630 [Chitinivibrionales bacterium]|nr:hypothetical protein [Chitinivibrionales bacterium]
MSAPEPDIATRTALYRRAEQPVRRLFGEHFGRLCAACGDVARETGEHVCCCIGVPCVKHIDKSPVLRAMVESSNEAAALVSRCRSAHVDTFLGPAGCTLDWGRPPPCNACICTPQRQCLLSVLPSARVLAFSRALRTYALIADPALRNLSTLEREVSALERETAVADTAIRTQPARFAEAVDKEISRLRRFAAQFSPGN